MRFGSSLPGSSSELLSRPFSRVFLASRLYTVGPATFAATALVLTLTALVRERAIHIAGIRTKEANAPELSEKELEKAAGGASTPAFIKASSR